MSYTAPDLLEKSNDPSYRNWHAVGDALMFLGDGLKKYAEDKMKELHALITTNVGGPTVMCTCATGTKSNPHKGKTSCIWAQELKKIHLFKNKIDIPWNQSDSSKWHDPVVGYWEIAKLFMSDLGSDQSKVIDPNSTDIGPLLNLFRFCKHFKIQKSLLKAVTYRRNQWAHAPNRRLSDSDKNAAFQDIKLLIKDPQLLVSKNVQNCKIAIGKVETADLSMLQQNELRLIQAYQRIREYEELEAEVKFLRKCVINLLTVLLFVILLPWRNLPGWLQSCVTVVFIFSQIVDKNGIVHDKGNVVRISNADE